VNADIQQEREPHKEMRQLETDSKEALEGRDKKVAVQISEPWQELKEELNQARRNRQSLETDLEKLQRDRKKEISRIQDQLEAQVEL